MNQSTILESTLRFVVLALPGLIGLLAGTVFLFPVPGQSVLRGLILIALSSVLVLVGVNETRRPLYLLIPLMIPVGLSISPDGHLAPGITAGALMIGTLCAVRFIYRNIAKKDLPVPDGPADSTSN